ncbi:MAG: trehalose operon repressor [Clostridium perfringens]|nr:trehalose operon repressor [Clostridium perfringens]
MESKYFNIYNDIMTKIENGELVPNEKLPSESVYMDMYNVSRDTIRKSLNLLEQNGYIHKAKGKGSFVLDVNKFNFPVSGVVSFKELSEKMNLKVETIVEKFETAKKDSPIKKNLNCSENDEIWEIFRVRKIGNEKIILDKDYINKKFVENLTKEICEDSIYNYIENILGIKIAFAKKEITVSRVTDEDRKYLDVNGYDTIVVVKSFTYLENGSLFQYTESRHRPDRFRFVDFARRK